MRKEWLDHRRKSVSFSKLDYFGREGNLIYEKEEPFLNRGHVLVKEGDWLIIGILKSNSTEGYVREVWILDGDDTVYWLCKLL